LIPGLPWRARGRWRVASILVHCVVLAALGGCVHAPSAPRAAAEAVPLYVIRRGWHVDVAFARAGLSPELAVLAATFPGASHLVIGFGDERYLIGRAPHALSGIAALWPGRGLMLVTGLRADPGRAFGASRVIELQVSPTGMESAQRQVARAFANGTTAAVRANGPYEGSVFFESARRYSATFTCNTWAAEVLRAAGIDVDPHGTLFASQLWRQVRTAAAKQALPDATQPQGGREPSEHTTVVPEF
jgi:Protein of unknown function (DUF2459)